VAFAGSRDRAAGDNPTNDRTQNSDI
jgi:hypothetical protein